MGTFDDLLTLVKTETTERDEYGNPIKKSTERTVFCNVLSVYSGEFYRAATVGLRPSKVFEIHKFEYEGESECKYKGESYDVIRTFEKDDTCEIVAGEKIANKH